LSHKGCLHKKRKTEALLSCSLSLKSIAGRLLPSRAYFLFLFVLTKLNNNYLDNRKIMKKMKKMSHTLAKQHRRN